jgi:hypothetical protein
MQIKKNKFNKVKLYTGIAKVKEGTLPPRFVKYRFNKPENFLTWLQTRYEVFFINFYANTGTRKREQVGNYSKKQGLRLY